MLETKEEGRLRWLGALSQLVDGGVVLVDVAGTPEFASARALELTGCSDAGQLRERWPAVLQTLHFQEQSLGEEGKLYVLKSARTLTRADSNALLATRI